MSLEKLKLLLQSYQKYTYYFNITENNEEKRNQMTTLLLKQIKLLEKIKQTKEIMILNIGTNQKDFANFDTFGPRIGSKLTHLKSVPNITLYGSMQQPLHAQNLKEFYHKTKRERKEKIVIVTDAFRGNTQYYQTIQIRNQGIYPGSAEQKHLPKLGDISIGGQTATIEGKETKNDEEMEQFSNIAAEIIEKTIQLIKKRENPF